MSLSTDEEEQLMMILADCLANSQMLTPWERGFVQDVAQRYEEEGSQLFISGLMWKRLREAHEAAQL